MDQTSTLWRCQGSTVGLQISTALSLGLCPARTQSLMHSIALQCFARERKKPQPLPLSLSRSERESATLWRRTVRESWGQGTLKTWNRGKGLVVILPQRMSLVVGGWLDIVPGKVKESLYGSVKKELSESIQLMPLTEFISL